MKESEIDSMGGQAMSGEKGRIPWIVAVALLVVALGIVAVTLRHKVTVIDGTVLLLERWTGRVTLIHSDGRITKMEASRPAKNPGFRLSKLFTSHTRETGAKTAKGSGGRAAGASNPLKQSAKVPKKATEARQTAEKNSGAATAQKTTAKASPYGNGSTTSKDFAGTGAKIFSSIKWQEDQARFQMAIRPYTDEVKKLRRDKSETVCIDLVDGKGKAILTLAIPVDDMKPARDDKNKITALEYGKNIPLSKADFLSIQDWKIKKKV
jgi:hypothetical protein